MNWRASMHDSDRVHVIGEINAAVFNALPPSQQSPDRVQNLAMGLERHIWEKAVSRATYVQHVKFQLENIMKRGRQVDNIGFMAQNATIRQGANILQSASNSNAQTTNNLNAQISNNLNVQTSNGSDAIRSSNGLDNPNTENASGSDDEAKASQIKPAITSNGILIDSSSDTSHQVALTEQTPVLNTASLDVCSVKAQTISRLENSRNKNPGSSKCEVNGSSKCEVNDDFGNLIENTIQKSPLILGGTEYIIIGMSIVPLELSNEDKRLVDAHMQKISPIYNGIGFLIKELQSFNEFGKVKKLVVMAQMEGLAQDIYFIRPSTLLELQPTLIRFREYTEGLLKRNQATTSINTLASPALSQHNSGMSYQQTPLQSPRSNIILQQQHNSLSPSPNMAGGSPHLNRAAVARSIQQTQMAQQQAHFLQQSQHLQHRLQQIQQGLQQLSSMQQQQPITSQIASDMQKRQQFLLGQQQVTQQQLIQLQQQNLTTQQSIMRPPPSQPIDYQILRQQQQVYHQQQQQIQAAQAHMPAHFLENQRLNQQYQQQQMFESMSFHQRKFQSSNGSSLLDNQYLDVFPPVHVPQANNNPPSTLSNVSVLPTDFPTSARAGSGMENIFGPNFANLPSKVQSLESNKSDIKLGGAGDVNIDEFFNFNDEPSSNPPSTFLESAAELESEKSYEQSKMDEFFDFSTDRCLENTCLGKKRELDDRTKEDGDKRVKHGIFVPLQDGFENQHSLSSLYDNTGGSLMFGSLSEDAFDE